MAGWAAFGQIAGELATAGINSHSAHKSNRTNIQLQREQQAWEKEMSNTAVQRRRADIEAAGGNPAAAFVNGGEASTPSITPARVEPVRLNAPNIGSAILQAQQLKNMKAEEYKTTQEGRGSKIAADLAEGTFRSEIDKRINRNVEEYEWDNLTTEIKRSQTTSSAMEAKRWTEAVDAMISKAKTDAAAGRLDVAALENIAQIGGLEASKMQGVIQLILRALTK